MKQYLDLLQTIKDKGTQKPAARENMPGTLSLFGYQFRHDLSEGFPLLTTKKMFWKGIVTELLWFLRGDTNIKYLVDNGCNFWNEDAYNYFKKQHPDSKVTFEQFINSVKEGISIHDERDYQGLAYHKDLGMLETYKQGYRFGDCGYQYGKLWRAWEYTAWNPEDRQIPDSVHNKIDQIKDLIDGLKKNPMGRRHIVTAWNPATLNKMALNACHVLVQFNCRPLTYNERFKIFREKFPYYVNDPMWTEEPTEIRLNRNLTKTYNIPEYYLDCQLYQRSADVFLGVPFNIASYALLTHILAKICNMIPGDFIHTFGDVHIYDSHSEVVDEQLKRKPYPLPKLKMTDNEALWRGITQQGLDLSFDAFTTDDFVIEDYQYHPILKAKLSTGLF